MASKANQTKADQSLDGIESALTRTEMFIEENSKTLTIAILAIVVVVAGFIGVKRLYIQPLEEEAAGQMFMAERFFDRDSFDLALNGYGTYPGFLAVIDDYGITKTANLASYYAGICYLKLGNYEEAISFLKDFDTEDVLLGAAQYSAMGDAYAELKEYGKAVSAYKTGVNDYLNDFTTPFLLKKMGIIYEENAEFGKAAEQYRRIKKDFPESTEARDIEKYISRADLKSGR